MLISLRWWQFWCWLGPAWRHPQWSGCSAPAHWSRCLHLRHVPAKILCNILYNPHCLISNWHWHWYYRYYTHPYNISLFFNFRLAQQSHFMFATKFSRGEVTSALIIRLSHLPTPCKVSLSDVRDAVQKLLSGFFPSRGGGTPQFL